MAITYQPRWPAVLAVSLPVGLLAGAYAAALAALFGLLGWGEFRDIVFMGPVFIVVFGLMYLVRLRSWRLTVRDDSLLVERDRHQIILPWRELAELRVRRLGPVRVEELVFREAEVEPPLTMDPMSWRAARFRRVQPALYLADWRNSPLGAECPAS